MSNDRLSRGIVGVIAGALFVAAYLQYTAPFHAECDHTASDGECVGDYVTEKGGDREGAFMLGAFGILATWYAVSKREDQ